MSNASALDLTTLHASWFILSCCRKQFCQTSWVGWQLIWKMEERQPNSELCVYLLPVPVFKAGYDRMRRQFLRWHEMWWLWSSFIALIQRTYPGLVYRIISSWEIVDINNPADGVGGGHFNICQWRHIPFLEGPEEATTIIRVQLGLVSLVSSIGILNWYRIWSFPNIELKAEVSMNNKHVCTGFRGFRDGGRLMWWANTDEKQKLE